MTSSEIATENKLSALPESKDDVVGPHYCDNPVKTWYEVSDKDNYFIASWWNGTHYKDGPGGTMKVKVEKSGEVSIELSGSIEASANAIIAKSKATYGIRVVGKVSITTGHEYSHDVPSNKYGNLQYGDWGYKETWTKWRTSGDRCRKVKLGSGTAKLPTNSTGWKWWVTNA
ncbi:hypothetical protein [Streptomyces sp. NRRL S-646]|uniref:hypothetical protein n=1 Tax=Streptomyces sp. NRRL S-646 TaxID=1463917 RepID=UPI001F1E7334|nr:hypothetical protein [Streptomyces sp. NRRL S-646]